MEAVKQGSACVGLRSNTHVVIGVLLRRASELADYQQKIFKVDDHMGISISGLIADARVLRKFMIQECLNHKFVYDTPLQTGRLVVQISDKAQRFTQKSEKRPYGVGLLIAGYDKTGPHLYETDPSGNYYEYVAQAMGARSQTAKTYLEKNYEEFADCKLDDLIKHAISSLKGVSQQGKVTSKNIAICFVGKDTPFTRIAGDEVRPYVEDVLGAEDEDEEAAAAAAADAES
jgi:20S proteasome subunit alpha 6